MAKASPYSSRKGGFERAMTSAAPLTFATVALAGLAALYAVVRWGPELLLQGQELPPTDSYRRTELVVSARRGILLALPAFATVAVAWTGLRSFVVTRRGQIADRYIKAAELLGSDQAMTRLGALHALDQLSRDSREEDAAIQGTIASFLRFAARSGGRGSVDASNDEEISAALSILSRHRARHPQLTTAPWSGLRGIDLRERSLVGVELSGLDLSGSDVSGADFSEARLIACSLLDASALGTRFTAADFSRANLAGLKAGGARFEQASLVRADLRGASLVGSRFAEAVIDHADFRSADVSHSIFSVVGANTSDLRGANLDDALIPRSLMDGFAATGGAGVPRTGS